MKGALNDRFLLALLSILLLAVLVFGYFILEDHSTGFAYGQNLTEQQKTKAISIAMNDSFVKNEMENIAGSRDVEYYIKDVKPSSFYETGPNLTRTRVLPVVEIVIGNENASGTNVLAFVDLKEKRVVYIGFVKRVDKKGREPMITFENKSIINTGYNYNQNLTEEQKAEALRIALDDKRVQDELSGKEYSLNDIWISQIGESGLGYSYVEVYPSVSFMVGKVYQPGYMVDVKVDINKGKVIDILTHFRTPVPLEYLGNTS